MSVFIAKTGVKNRFINRTIYNINYKTMEMIQNGDNQKIHKRKKPRLETRTRNPIGGSKACADSRAPIRRIVCDGAVVKISYTHVSWFSEEFLKGKPIIEMCRTCGNTDKKKMECCNCDINFQKYVYLKDGFRTLLEKKKKGDEK